MYSEYLLHSIKCILILVLVFLKAMSLSPLYKAPSWSLALALFSPWPFLSLPSLLVYLLALSLLLVTCWGAGQTLALSSGLA